MSAPPRVRIPLQTSIRWMIRRDMPQVLLAEEASYVNGWTEDDFLTCLRQRNCIGMVAVHDEQVVGHMVYELHDHRIDLLNLAVHPAYRRRGVASQLISKLIAKLSGQQRTCLRVDVRESNLEAQLFLRDRGLRAVKVLRGYFEDTGEDGYRLEYHVGGGEERPGVGVNRLAQYGY